MSTNHPIPGLFQGVSQQAPALRSLEQCEANENCYATVADGLRRRPPTQHVAVLTTVPIFNPKVHQYFRGDGEHNIISVYDSAGHLKAWDGTTGVEKTIDTTGAPSYLAYLTTSDAITDIGMMTVADTTFIWNRTKTVAMKASTIVAQTPTLYVHLDQGRVNSTYSITLNATTVTVAVGNAAGADSTQTIGASLQTAVSGVTGFVCTQFGPLLVISRTDLADFTFALTDSAGNSLMTGLKNRVERYSDLPRVFLEGHTVEIANQADVGNNGSFWVTWKSTGSKEHGNWVETVAPNVGEPTDFDPDTMPLQLVRQADGTFHLSRVAWNPRLVGSTTGTTKVPSFVGAEINSMFFTRGRLGILANENFVMSRARSLFNFWPKSANIVADDDPIDESVDSAKVSTLRHAVPFQRTLMLFSDTTQFPVTGGESLTPRNVRADPATDFDCSPLVSPVSSGQDLFFVFERSSDGTSYSGVREYFVNQQAVTNDAVDVTAHIPQYIPSQVIGASVSSTEDVLLLNNRLRWNEVYWYKYLWDGDKRVQSAWGRWTFRPSDGVLSACIDKTTVHLVIMRVGGVYLEKMELQSTAKTDSLPFQIHLDSLALVDPTLLLGPLEGSTTMFGAPIMVPPGEGEIVAVASDGYTNREGATISMSNSGTWDDPVWTLKGDWTTTTAKMYFGVRYTSRYTFSRLFERDRTGQPMQAGRLQVKSMTVNFRNAVSFRCEVETPGRVTAAYKYSSIKLGILGSTIGKIVMRDDSFTFPVASDSSRATISLVNDSAYPSTFYSAEWNGTYIARAPRQ